MTKVTLTGWNVGFKKVQFNQFLRARWGLGLAEAKTVVDRVLNDERVELELQQFSCIDRQKMIELGVKLD